MLVLTAAAGNTGWHYMITRHARYAPHLSNYSGAAGDGPSRLLRASTPARSSSPTTRARISSKPVTHPRSSTRQRTVLPTSMPSWKPTVAASASFPTAGSTSRRRALHGGAQHLVRQPPGKHAAHPCGRPGPAHDRRPLLHGPERICPLRRHQRRADPGSRALLSPREPGGAAAAELHGDLHDNRVHRRALDVLLRGDADAAGHGPGRLDVRRHRPLHRPRRQRRPEVPGLGFRYDTDERWPLPNPTGLEGVFEGYCPPHYRHAGRC